VFGLQLSAPKNLPQPFLKLLNLELESFKIGQGKFFVSAELLRILKNYKKIILNTKTKSKEK
jgi:hypothetical protein